MAQKKNNKSNNSSQDGIQMSKWLWIIVIGAVLYFAYHEGMLNQDSTPINEEEQVQEDKTNNKKRKKKKEIREDETDNNSDIDEVREGEDEVEYDSKSFNADKIKDLELPTHPDYELVRHTYYSLGYAEAHEQAAWVAYRLTYDETTGDADRKDDKFKPDDDVSTGSALPNDYSSSGYDRGHLAPAADFVFSESALAETFYMSNMSPQAPDFNRGIWKHLEEQVRAWIRKDKTFYVVSGGVLKKGLKKIGKRNKVSVPDYYYKIIMDLKAPEIKAIAFLMPNEGSQEPLESFVVSIDEIEEKTGIDFFPKLPDALEKQLEASTNYTKWLKSK